MKKKSDMIINTVLIVASIVIIAFLIVKAEGNRFFIILDLVCSFCVWFACQKGIKLMLDQFEENNKKKMTWKQILLFDAILVIIGIALVVSKVIENARGFDAIGARFHSKMNLWLIFSYAIILMLAIGYTCEVIYEAFRKRYRYEKKTIELENNGEEVLIDVDVFVKTSYKGAIIGTEVECVVNDEKLTVAGIDENEATEKFIELYKKRTS